MSLLFFSYARRDDDPYMRKLYDDLVGQLAVKSATPVEEVGFRDTHNLDLGERWPAELTGALARAACMVCVWSPTYFTREYCGKEFTFFKERLSQFKMSGAPLILPLVWQPQLKGNEPVPPVVVELQRSADFGKEYEQRGLYGIMRLNKFADLYQEILDKITNRVLDITTSHELPTWEDPPDLALRSNAFAAAENAARAIAAVQGGPGHVRFVVFAARRDELAQLEQLASQNKLPPVGAYLDRYGDGYADWRPYLPPRSERLGPLLQALAAEVDLTSDILAPDENLWSTLKVAAKNNNLVLFVVDPWVLRFESYQEHLKEYDRRNFLNAALVAPWNNRPAERAEVADALGQAILLTFANKSRSEGKTFRFGISSPEEFKTQLRETLVELRKRIFEHADVARRAEGLGVIVKPMISAVGS